MAWQCQLVMNVFHCASRQWKWTVDDITRSDIFAKFKALFSLLDKFDFNLLCAVGR